jgi:methylmalonyl-CoA mutase C-terminal domain/subunit
MMGDHLVNTELQALPVRVLVTKIGLDGHDRGSRVVAAFLRDAGMEVIYTAPWQEINDVISIALQEDVDVVGISSLATDHLMIPDLSEAMRKAGLGNIALVVGGIVPQQEQQMLVESGVAHVFGPGTSRDDIVASVSRLGRAVRREKLEGVAS